MKNLIQAAAVTLFAASTVQAQQAVQWKVSDGGNGHWYQATSIRFRNFAAAQTFAVQAGGHLVTLTSEGENGFVSAMATGDFLLGGFQDLSSQGYSEPSGGWKWVTGEPWQFTRWRAGEPNNNGQIDANAASEQYLLWWRPGMPANDEWNDGFNDATAEFSWDIRAIIEWSADCNNDGIVDKGQILRGQLQDANANGVPDVCQQPICRDADFFPDRNINGVDLGVLLSQWGAPTQYTVADLNRDGVVDGIDLGLFLSFWGPCPY